MGSLDESTKDLLEQAGAGDRDAVEALISRYLSRLERWARGRLPPWARGQVDTQDLVQDVLMRTLGRLDAFEASGTGSLHAYLRTAVKNRVSDECRRALRSPQMSAIDSRLEDNRRSPAEAAMGREHLERYEQALATLSAVDQDLVVGRVELGLSYSELAAAVGKPSPDAARMAVNRALVRLAGEMASE